ncbi:hypothetical protein SAMN02745146_0427 [Hymenobacter daecheongensis DSM 21074]|uniref:Secretin and TonB N terminus short domain-containing protein n=1 Tax=Hymenobacter daecheongensis DSM 21074 TaxID=1121955 RepID=A0A1M6A073_9BACT|nr:hypothetical protein [Hymenobacter daecheongensis]SHI29875.1 hypothetical protein SAMN02745146_0427 [Hymenobacter daecheongensis DSM 21074]
MRPSFALVFCLLLLHSAVLAQVPAALSRRVRVAATDEPLEQVLRDIARQSGVPFSYSSTFIPLQKRVTLHTRGTEPVAAVLGQLLPARQISYQLVGGQIVLWRTGTQPPFTPGNAEKPRPAVAASSAAARPARLAAPVGPAVRPVFDSKKTALSSPAGNSPKTVAGKAPSGKARPSEPTQARLASARKPAGATHPAAIPARPTKVALAAAAARPAVPDSVAGRRLANAETSQPAVEGRRVSVLARLPQSARQRTARAATALARTTKRAGRTLSSSTSQLTNAARALADSVATAAAKASPPLRTATRRLAALARPADPLASRPVLVQSGLAGRDTLLAAIPLKPKVESTRPYYRRLGQVSLVPPLGSNWLKSGRTVNHVSLNLLAGYSAGLKGAELGGLVNIERDTVLGLQAAGLLNVVGTEVKGTQLAGLFNIIGGSAYGVQAAGLGNIGRDDVRGLQVAGLFNIGGGAARSRQNPARPTLARRLLGLPRLLATDSAASTMGAPNPGSRPGPLLQAAGLFNLTGNDVTGLQTAPLLNVARQVRGAQIGLVNVGKHVRGMQLGLINVADSVDGVSLGIINIVRHGYLHGEVWASESLPLNAVLKLGVRHYYTLVGVATQPFGTRFRWASGFGIGTASRPHGRFTYSLDVMQWALAEPAISTRETRLLTQLRPAVAWQLEPAGHLQLVLAPTLNLALAYNTTTPPDWDFGQNQQLLLDRSSNRSLTRLWPGLQIGLRF